jgi:ParB-like chromosome segregation protein Spo0J
MAQEHALRRRAGAPADKPAGAPRGGVPRNGVPRNGVHTVEIRALDPADSPRLTGENRDHTLRLAETEDVLPPILVHIATMRVIDGMHRLHAARLRGRETIEAEFFDGSEEDAFIQAVTANTRHGLPLARADRRAAAARILVSHPHLSDRIIAAYTALSQQTVRTIRRSTALAPQLSVRRGADGKLRPLSGEAGRRRAAEIIAARPTASLREVAANAGISVGTAHDVRSRLYRGEDPVHLGLPRTSARGRQARANEARGRQDGCGRAGPPEPVRKTPGGFDAADHQTILQSLAKDPTIRHTESGRELLLWLRTHVLGVGDWPALSNSVPTHRTTTVAHLARQCADSWRQFAQELDRRMEAGGPPATASGTLRAGG